MLSQKITKGVLDLKHSPLAIQQRPKAHSYVATLPYTLLTRVEPLLHSLKMSEAKTRQTPGPTLVVHVRAEYDGPAVTIIGKGRIGRAFAQMAGER